MAAQREVVERSLTDALLRHQVMLLRLSEGERRKFTAVVQEIDRDLRKRLLTGELTEFTRARLEKQLAYIDRLLTELLGDFQRTLLADLDDIAKQEVAFTGQLFERVLDYEATLPSVPQMRAAILGNPLSIKAGSLLKEFISSWTEAERQAVIGAIRRGVFEGQTNAQIVQAIRGTRSARYSDGLLEVTARNARTVVHTAVQHVSAQARQETVNLNSDVVRAIRWVSTLDSKTCQTCRSLDGRLFPREKGPRPPIHPFCRCTFTFELSSKYRLFSKGGTRASVGAAGGAQVAAQLDYYAWLKTQPDSFQDVALGPKRAKLFRDGGLSPERFSAMQLDRRWEPLTLEEMKRLEPLAFMRAGIT